MNHPKRETPDVPPAIAGTAALGLLPAPDAALDGSIITIAGPNGSGKTTLLDAMRTLLGLDCSGGRSYKTYARHANAETTWLRAGGQPSAWPPDLDPSVCAQPALCGPGHAGLPHRAQRRRLAAPLLMSDGDVAIETLAQLPEKDWLGIEAWQAPGRRRPDARDRRVLALEQGQTDRLCEFSPKELLRLVFEVFGDQEVLDRYEEARRHQQHLAAR
jgi:energy-coupling factor transporter ATP-binding protein EcfA2